MEEVFIREVEKLSKLSPVTMDMGIKSDLLMDSLVFTKLIIKLEEAFDIEFGDDDYIMDEDVKLRDIYGKIQEIKRKG